MKKIDIYGEPVKLTLNKKNSIQTSLGGLFTIITFFIVLIFTWFIGKDIIHKEKPISYIQTDIFQRFLHINITNHNFPFSATLTDENNVPLLDFSYLKMRLYSLQYEIDENTGNYGLKNTISHEMEQCNYSNYPLIKKDQFDNTQLGLTFCPKNQNFSLYGYWNEEKLNVLQISIERCINSTDNPIICKSPEQIKEYVSKTGTNLNIYYIDTKVMINNNTHPMEFLTTSSYRYVIPEYFKKIIFKIQKQNIDTDNGFLFTSNEKLEFFKMAEDFNDLRLIDERDYKLLAFEIYSSNFSQTYFRRYIKVSEIIASLGGVLKVFSLGFLYINFIFSKVEKNVSIANELFVLNSKIIKDSTKIEKNNNNLNNIHTLMNNYVTDFKKKMNDVREINEEKVVCNIETKSLKKTNQHGLFNNIFNQENKNEEIGKIMKIRKFLTIRNSDRKLNFDFCDIMTVICKSYCKKKIHNKFKENYFYYKKAKYSMENYFDLIFMIKKFEEVRILKDCLLSEVQKNMVEIISKPIISMKDQFKKNSLSVNVKDTQNVINNIYEFFMKEDFKENIIDKNIIEKIDEYIEKSYFY